MQLKHKIYSILSVFCLACILTLVSVWAVTETKFKVSGNIEYTASQSAFEYDETNGYYYVEMGTYGESNEPVRWRLVGINGQHFDGTTTPTAGAGRGTFILATLIDTVVAYDNEGKSSDYGTSDARAYLNGDYITDLNLANDELYAKITAREISDLYSDISFDGEIIDVPSGVTGSDKLWLPSLVELALVKTLLSKKSSKDSFSSLNK